MRNKICETCPLAEECTIELEVVPSEVCLNACRGLLGNEYRALFQTVCLAKAPDPPEGIRKLQYAVRVLQGVKNTSE